MRINIQAYKRRPYDRSRLSLVRDAGANFLDIEGCKLTGPIALDMEIEFTGSSYLLSGQVETAVQMQCSRCLADMVLPLRGNFCWNLVENEHRAEFADTEDVLPLINDEADITEAVYEALLIALPVAAVCSPECKGLCPSCGRDLNRETCQCAKGEIDPRWEKLAQLNTRRNTDGST